MVRVKTIQLTFSGAAAVLNDSQQCERLLDTIVQSIGLTKLHSVSHQFEPQGISIVQLLAESHIALHTWPETEQGYITITTCKIGALDEDQITNILKQYQLTVHELTSIAESSV